MFYYIVASLSIIIAYFLGSVNFAIPISKAVKGVDIRELGNKNPGTSNTMREVGIFWGILLVILDAAKAAVPIILLKIFVFKEDTNFDYAILYLVGISAVFGHCKSIFLNFTGGGGIATMQGVFLFFIPVEYLLCMILSFFFVITIFKNSKYKWGQKAPIAFLTMTPFVTLLSSIFIDIPLFAHFKIGGHMPAVIVGTFVMALMIFAINSKFLKTQVRKKNI